MENMKVKCIEDGSKAWVMCPICRKGKVLKVNGDVSAQRLPVYCRFCKRESVIDIAKNPRYPGGVSVSLSEPKSKPIPSENPSETASI